MNNDYFINDKLIFFYNYNDLFKIINNLLFENKIIKIKIEIDNIKFSEHQLIIQKIQCFNIEFIENIFRYQKSIKSNSEIENIILAQKINEQALKKTLNKLKTGISELELKKHLISNLYLCGAQGLAFDPIISFGKNTSYPHHISNNTTILMPGNLIMFDFGCKYKYYCSDMTRTFAFKYISKKEEKIYNIVLKIQNLIINYIKIGFKFSEIDLYSRNLFKSFGFEKFFCHSIGHSLGMNIHEYPYFTKNENYQLCNGNIFTIEPGIYFKNEFGIRIEDMLFLKNEKIINITKQDKKLSIL